MKKILSVLFFVFATALFAEYQAFSYKAVLRRPEVVLKMQGGRAVETYTIKTVTLKGWLVTVCCYPCGARFGKNYPSWLYVTSSDDRGTVWKIPVRVDGGVFGQNISPEIVSSWNRSRMFFDPCQIVYVKKVSKSWFRMEAYPCVTHEAQVSRKRTCCYVEEQGVLGINLLKAALTHAGYGSASWKRGPDPDDWFNPYIRNASGMVTGTVDVSRGFAIDPSNASIYSTAPVCGTFSVSFNSKMTDEIRGTADWDVIDQRVFRHFDERNKMEQEGDEDLWWDVPIIDQWW